jgi:hypothetical protein
MNIIYTVTMHMVYNKYIKGKKMPYLDMSGGELEISVQVGPANTQDPCENVTRLTLQHVICSLSLKSIRD